MWNKRNKNQKSYAPFKIRLNRRKFGSMKIFISVTVAVLFGFIPIIYLFMYFMEISLPRFSFLSPLNLGSIMSDIILDLYEHLLGIYDIEGYKYLPEINFDKFFMDNQDSSKGSVAESGVNQPINRGRSDSNDSNFEKYFRMISLNIFSQDVNPIPGATIIDTEQYNLPSNPVTQRTLCHLTLGERQVRLEQLDKLGRKEGLFSISNVDRDCESATVSYYKPVPDAHINTKQANLLKQLWEVFPTGNSYTPAGGGPKCTLQKYLLEGRLRNDLDLANDNANWQYKANQRKTLAMGIRYDPSKPVGYYQPWANDIGDAISKCKRNNNGMNIRPELDSESQVFLTTFMNTHPDMSPTIMRSNIIGQLKNL